MPVRGSCLSMLLRSTNGVGILLRGPTAMVAHQVAHQRVIAVALVIELGFPTEVFHLSPYPLGQLSCICRECVAERDRLCPLDIIGGNDPFERVRVGAMAHIFLFDLVDPGTHRLRTIMRCRDEIMGKRSGGRLDDTWSGDGG